MAKPQTVGKLADFLTLNPFERDGATRVDWESVLNEEITLTDYEVSVQYNKDGNEMRFACLRFELEGVDTTTLIWSGVIVDQLGRIDKANLPLVAKLAKVKSSGSKFSYVAFVS